MTGTCSEICLKDFEQRSNTLNNDFQSLGKKKKQRCATEVREKEQSNLMLLLESQK